MLVANVVDRDVPTAHADDEVFSAARRLLQGGCGILPVVAEDGRGARVIGLLRYRDAFVATYDRGRRDGIPVGAAMSSSFVSCRASDSLGAGLRSLRRSGTDAIPVLDEEGYLVGVLSFAHLLRDATG
jgi:CBS-domain-containing membrane protein